MRSPVRGTALPPASFFINQRGRPLPHAVRSCGPADLGGHIPSRPSKTTKPPTWRGRHIGGAGQHGSTPWFHSLGISARPDNGGQPSGDTAAGVPAGSPRLPAGTPAAGAFHRFSAKNAHSLRRFLSVTERSGYFLPVACFLSPGKPGLVSIIIHFRKKSTPIFRPGCHRQNIGGPPTRTGIPTPGSAPPTPK